MEKKLYPLKFVPIPSPRPWGGSRLVEGLGKRFMTVDHKGNEIPYSTDAMIGESWEIADMGFEDSIVENGWLAGNTIGELMETYLERIVGEDVYKYYGRQFPLLVKFLDINGKLSVQVHPDDEIAAERYDALGKPELWYVLDAKPGAKMYLGFNRDMTAAEFYTRCNEGTVEEVLNVIYPKKGDVIYVAPGTVHSADAGLLVVEVQASSDMVFRLYDWGRESDPATARPMHLEEAIDMIDYRAFDQGLYRKGPLWGEEASGRPCKATECHCGEDCHCHEEGHECHCHDHEHVHADEGGAVETLIELPQFNVTKLKLSDPLHIYTEKFESFIVYICIEGAASVQVPSTRDNGESYMETFELSKGETILIPADMSDFYLVPRDRSTELLEAVTRPVEDQDEYIDPSTEPFLENEDYEGLEDGAFDDDEPSAGPAGASPLNFFS